MKVSNYNNLLKLNSINKYIYYNAFQRKYLILNEEELRNIESLLENLNKDYYEEKEVEQIKKLSKIGAILPTDFDELNYLKVSYNKHRYDNSKLTLVINPTLNCNFRCIYCYEKHVNSKIDNKTKNLLINLVKEKCKQIDELEVSWFGGEPMLEFETISYLSKKFKDICIANNCIYKSNMTTNGYLFDLENIQELKNSNIDNLQITLDGPEKFHNEKRKLINGNGTFNKIKNNILQLCDNNINVILRINVDENNYDSIPELFESIPKEYRNKIKINISNLFEHKNNLNLYQLYKTAILKGFIYADTTNSFIKCEGGTPNALTIYPDGKLTFCSRAAEEGYFYGNLENEKLNINNKPLYYNFHSTSVFEDPKCIKCKTLPICMGNCIFSKFKCKDKCSESGDLSINERIKLHYLSDHQKENLEELCNV